MSVDINLLSTDAQHVFEAAMKLSPGERARLADKLSLTIDPLASSEWRQAWGSGNCAPSRGGRRRFCEAS
jgi:hypothetical protein